MNKDKLHVYTLGELRHIPEFQECIIHYRPNKLKGWGGIPEKDKKIGEVFVYHQADDCQEYDERQFNLNEPNPIKENFQVETVKILDVAKDKAGSVHFHVKKEEIFYNLRGLFHILLIKDGLQVLLELKEGQCVKVKPGMVHQIIGKEEKNQLLEVSTLDKATDSYRLVKGD